MSIAQSENTIVNEITIDAPAAKVFAALTEPEQLTQWWGADGKYHTEKMQVDLRVGGGWKTTGTGASGESFTVEGEYLIVEPPHLLEFTWKHDWSDAPEETIVRYELFEKGPSTLLRVTHSGFGTTESRDNHNMGWAMVLEWLKAYATR